MKQINLETNINLYSKTILSDYNYFLIQELYMPIVGSDGVSLYTLFSNRIKMGKKSVDFNELTAFLCISLNDVINAKKKLEAVGLISTYSKIESETRELSVVLYSPKSPKKFFLDIVLKGLLLQRIGQDKVNEIKEYFKIDSLDKSQLVEDSANFIDVFSVDFDSNDFKYDSEKNEILFDFKSKNSTLKFDFAYFFRKFAEKYDVEENFFTKEDKTTISSLANLYGYNEDFMIEIIIDCINSVDKKLDAKKLQKVCYNSQIIEKAVVKKTRKSPNSAGSKNPMALKIKYMEEYTPYQYLKLRQNNIAPVKSDMNVLSYLATNLGLTNGVINALVDYILETNNNILARNLIEKIGATLVRENIETAFDALNYLSGFNKKTEVKESGSAEILKENAVKEEANNDDIWEKMKEFE